MPPSKSLQSPLVLQPVWQVRRCAGCPGGQVSSFGRHPTHWPVTCRSAGSGPYGRRRCCGAVLPALPPLPPRCRRCHRCHHPSGAAEGVRRVHAGGDVCGAAELRDSARRGDTRANTSRARWIAYPWSLGSRAMRPERRSRSVDTRTADGRPEAVRCSAVTCPSSYLALGCDSGTSSGERPQPLRGVGVGVRRADTAPPRRQLASGAPWMAAVAVGGARSWQRSQSERLAPEKPHDACRARSGLEPRPTPGRAGTRRERLRAGRRGCEGSGTLSSACRFGRRWATRSWPRSRPRA